MIIVGIQHLYQVTGQVGILYRTIVITTIECIQRELLLRLCIPHHQGIYDAVVISHDWHIIWHRQYGIVVLMNELGIAVRLLLCTYISAELHLTGIFRTLQFEWVTVAQPVIRHLMLVSVHDLLFEHTIVVMDTCTIGRIAKGGQRIQEAGSQSTQTTVTKSRIRLFILNGIDVVTQFIQCLFYRIIGAQVDQVIPQCTTH